MLVFVGLVVYILFLRALIGDLSGNRARKMFLAWSIIPIILLMTLRSHLLDVIGDLQTYYEFYQYASTVSFAEALNSNRFEAGYVLLNTVFSHIFPAPRMIFFIEAVFCNVSVAYFIQKNSKSVFLSMLFYMSLGTMTFMFTGFRQAFAMSICLFAVEAIRKQKLWRFLVLVGIASTFHNTAVIFLPMYWLANNRISLWNIVIVGVVIGLSFVLVGRIATLVNALFSMKYGAGTSNSLMNGMVQITISGMAIMLLYRVRKSAEDRLVFNMALWGLGIYVLRIVLLPAERVSYYFSMALMLAFPIALDRFWKNERMFVKLLVTLLTLMLFMYRMSYLEIGDYRFFWQGA